MDTKIYTKSGLTGSLWIGTLGNIPTGKFYLGNYFLVKNITDENIELEVKMPGSKEYIKTIFYPEWNVELIQEIKDAPLKSLQYGY